MTMPKGSPELTSARKEEIINACEALYKTESFKDITIKEIGNITSFTRTSIYNYFQTKEEIFLALLGREYDRMSSALEELMRERPSMTGDEFAHSLARLLEERIQLLKLMSMNHYDMESGSRPERLTEFKRSFGRSISSVELCLKRYFPSMTEEDRKTFLYSFFPFMFGIYPYAFATETQKKAMTDAGMEYPELTVHDMTYNFIKRLLNV